MPFFAGGVRQLREGLHLGLCFLRASQMLQHLSPQVVNAGAVGIELEGGVNLSQRFRIFVLALINASELEMGAGELGIEP